MLLTIEAYYHDGKIDLKEIPEGIKESKVLITFLEKKEEEVIPVIDWEELENNTSSVDKWVGIMSGVDISDVRKARKDYIEEKHR